ncbi:unnamed protein product (macronuclear) [Paramecium tetraurelia]|uniref:Uncharacterized protein n=1 Tax=Paramecium tetraurelia TaxID=5888 RepID=A0DYH8_PARTE|nr:uncharacterized protein GSPATT00003063001 [Paramecium tetraurelia]CAK88095.1 unnamed protein product [Paramecium tetraurelia]|eukprot:XP_001455492.1 hypothetical protein (macronuclear) [Paramecium tetraurelia strain d4-2]
MRKSFQIIFGIDSRKEKREPIIQERVQQEFVFDSQKSEQHQNQFLMMNLQRKRTNQYLYASERLRSIYQIKIQSNGFEKIPIIAYPKDNTEVIGLFQVMEKSKFEFESCQMELESLDSGSLFGEKLAQKSAIIMTCVSKEDFRPYYAQEQSQDNDNIQSQSSQQHHKKIKQPKKQQTIFGLNKSKVEFIREDKEQKSQYNNSESHFKRLGGILEDYILFYCPLFQKMKVFITKSFKIKVLRKRCSIQQQILKNIQIEFSNLNKIKFTNDLYFELNDSFQQIGLKKTNSQINSDDQTSRRKITNTKSNQIKFCNEKNPFIIWDDDNLSLNNRFSTPWQSSNLMKVFFNEFDDYNRISENIQFEDNGKQLENQEKR